MVIGGKTRGRYPTEISLVNSDCGFIANSSRKFVILQGFILIPNFGSLIEVSSYLDIIVCAVCR